MRSVTSGFKSAIRNNAVYSDGYVIIKDGASFNRTYNSDELNLIEIMNDIFKNDTYIGEIGQCALKLNLLGDNTSLLPLDKEITIEVYLGVKVGVSYEYVKYQDFILLEAKYNETTNVTEILATDKLVLLNQDFTDNNTYPMTLGNYVESVVVACGLQLENKTWLNNGFSLASQPFPDVYNAREIIEKAAELAMSFVVINPNTNKVDFRNFYTKLTTNAFDEEFDQDEFYKLKLRDKNLGTNGVNTLVLRLSQVEGENNTVVNATNVGIDGNIEVVISDNDFINSEAKRLSIINTMFTRIDGLKYQPLDLEYRGFPYLELGDVIKVVGKNGTYYFPILETMIKYNGGLFGTIKAEPLINTETKYRNTNPLQNRVRNAEIKVDKVNGEISAIVSDVETVSAVANSKARTFLSTPTTPYYVGDIWIETDATTGGNRVCTTERLTGAYVAGDWTKEGVTSRIDSAELKITPTAITSTVRSSTEYTNDLGAKENTVFKQNTAPAHLDGRLWLNTSVTPNVLNRSNGTAWVRATPTEASEVGAYSSGQVDTLLTSYSTITQTASSIALEIGKIEVGATNLMRSSSGSNPMGWFVGSQANITYFNNYVRGQGNSATNPSYPRIQNLSIRNMQLDLTKQYTLSFEARANASATRAWTISQSNGLNVVTSGSASVTTTWKRFEFTFIPAVQINSTTDFFIYCGAITGDTTSWLELRDVQLEIGNKATAYKNANNELSTTNYIFDGSYATFRNGGLKILNNAGSTVFDADVNGNLDITGKITADSGSIADFSLIPNYANIVSGTSGKAITAGSGSNRVGMSPGITTGGFVYSFWAGNDNPLNAPFRVLRNGGLRCTDAVIGGWTMSGTSISRGSTSLNATGTNGTLTIGGGTLSAGSSSQMSYSGAFKITGTTAYSGSINAGTSLINTSGETTRMNYNGQWTATGVRWGVNGGSALSDLRLKHDIKDIDGSFIFKLRPVEFRYDVDGRDLQFGLIAQEVEELLGDNVAIVKKPNEDNEHYGLDYTQLIAPMVATIQSQQKKIDELEERLAKLEQLLNV